MDLKFPPLCVSRKRVVNGKTDLTIPLYVSPASGAAMEKKPDRTQTPKLLHFHPEFR